MNKKLLFGTTLVSLIADTLAWIAKSNVTFKTSKVTIKNSKIPKSFSGFKIAQVTDYHNRDWGDRVAKRIRRERPDIIVITGDLIDAQRTNEKVAIDFIEAIIDVAPIYYVAGNHECWYYTFPEFREKLEKLGVKFLENRAEYIEKKGEKIQIVGAWDTDFSEKLVYTGKPEEVIANNLKSIIDYSCFNIVLSHRPNYFEKYVEMNIDLVLTGHAHGGQVRIPFVGGLFAPGQGAFPKYTSGLYHKNTTDMYVSRGLGNSVVPLRINDSFELVMFELKS